jgi:hypothetical protein
MLSITSIKKWQPCHTKVGFFEVHETMGATMAMQLKYLLDMNYWTKYYHMWRMRVLIWAPSRWSQQVLSFVLHSCCHNLMLPFIMGMPCLSVINMLQMISRCVKECERFLLKLSNHLCRRQLLGPRKVGRPNKSGLRLVEIPNVALKN